MDDVTRQALATAVGVLAAVYVALFMGLEEPFWAALSVMVIANVDRDALFTKGVLRVAGTLIGVISGFYVSQWTEGEVVQQAVLAAIAAGVGTYVRQRSVYAYAWFYGALTFMLMILYSIVEPQALYSFAHYRCYEIIVGVVCGTVASWALGPRAGGLHVRLVAQPGTLGAQEAWRQSCIAVLAVLVIIMAWSWFDLPQLPQVLVSSLIVIDSDPVATRHKGWQRILGCAIGGASGLVVIAIDAVDIWWWSTMLFLGVFTFARVHLTKSDNAYIGTQSAIAYLVTLVGSGPPLMLYPPVDRLVGIMIGVSIITVLVWALSPRLSGANVRTDSV